MAWRSFGENDWSARAPSGANAVYAGPRFSFVDPGPSANLNRRFSLNIDLRFDHGMTMTRRGKAPGFVSRESGLDRMMRRSGYAKEHQTGDASFDRRAYLGLGDPEAARALGDDPEARRLIMELFEAGVSRIEVSGERLRLRLRYAPSPAMDGGKALSAIAVRLDALARRWPGGASRPWRGRHPLSLNRRTLGLAWAGAWIVAVLWAAWFAEEADVRQIETFATPDWRGMAILFAAIVAPAGLLFTRRADAHRLLAAVALAALAILPFSYRLRVVETNRQTANARASMRAEPTALIENPDAAAIS